MLTKQKVLRSRVKRADQRRVGKRVGIGRVGVSAVALLASLVVVGPAAGSVSAVTTEPVSFLVTGTGNGHGRGLSQWGAYGRAVNGGQSWTTILDAYYGGTKAGTAPNSDLRVRLAGADGFAVVGAISPIRQLRWTAPGAGDSIDYASVYVKQTSTNIFEVYGMTADLACTTNVQMPLPTGTFSTDSPKSDEVKQIQAFLNAYGFDAGPPDGIYGSRTAAAVGRFQTARSLPATGIWTAVELAAAAELMAAAPAGNWTLLATNVTGPITLASRDQAVDAPAADTLGLCGTAQGIVHYRGTLEVQGTSEGTRVINAVPVESYLRGVVPREVSASWGNTAAGMNALQAQAVAARSYALSQNRYAYAQTCDTSACQVYGGAALRSTPTAPANVREEPNTDTAVASTAGVVRRWPDGSIVATEFSASNGPRTAGGAFPPIDDPLDDVPGNQYHTWTRTISAAEVATAFELGSVAGVKSEPDPGSPYDGIWASRVRLNAGTVVSAWTFRNKLGLPSPGFKLEPIYPSVQSSCMPESFDTFAMVGDSVGVSVAGSPAAPLRLRLDNAFATASYDVLSSRATQTGSVEDGVTAAARVPTGTEIVVVELGYNDLPSKLGPRVDALMSVLKDRQVGRVLWVNLSERRPEFAESNVALEQASKRWANMRVLDWRSASAAKDAWFTDGVHLTAAGSTGLSAFITQEVAITAGVSNGTCLSWRGERLADEGSLSVPVLGRAGVPNSLDQVKGVALNVTAVNPGGSTHLKVWECGQPQPETSSINFVKGNTTPNAIILPLSKTGEVCVWSKSATDVIVDVNGWFGVESGLQVSTGRLLDTRPNNRASAGQTVRVPVRGKFGIPSSKDDVQAVSLNIVGVQGSGLGHLKVWECDETMPDTSSVNFAPGSGFSNAVVVPLRGSGEVCIRTSTPVDIVVDATGWFDRNADVHPVEKRLHDSRQSGGRMAAETQRAVANGSAVSIPNNTVTGVIYNVTAVRPDGIGHLRSWKCGTDKPPTSSVNYRPNMATPNAVLLALSSADSICVWTTHGTDLVVDAVVAFGANAGLHSASARLTDTRIAVG